MAGRYELRYSDGDIDHDALELSILSLNEVKVRMLLIKGCDHGLQTFCLLIVGTKSLGEKRSHCRRSRFALSCWFLNEKIFFSVVFLISDVIPAFAVDEPQYVKLLLDLDFISAAADVEMTCIPCSDADR